MTKKNESSEKEKNEKKKADKLPFFKILFRIAPMVYKVFPISYIFFALIAIAHGTSWAVGTFANQRLYDALANSILNGGAVSKIYISAGIVAAVTIGCQILNGVHNFLYGIFFGKASGRISEKIHFKASTLSAAVFEDKNRLDDINKATEGMYNGCNNYLLNLYTAAKSYYNKGRHVSSVKINS